MSGVRQVLFIQGGGAGTHDDWDKKLVESLARELGEGYELRYPRMPQEDEPSPDTWGPVIRREVADLADGAVLVGHSVGATILLDEIARRPPPQVVGAVVVIAAPFVGAEGWSSKELGLPENLGARLPAGAQVHVFHGLADETAPPWHADLYGRAVPQARVHLLPGRNHQLDNDLSEVATAIRQHGIRDQTALRDTS
jgi:predicted alpha/beta hydrolase family esterase